MEISGKDKECFPTDQQGYDAFCDFLRSACGVVLGENKEYLVNSRLNKLMADNGIGSLIELVYQLNQSPPNSRLYTSVVDAMTTNETSWFRDGYPYEFLKEQLLPSAEAEGRELRIWSAASSSGQEPYSISIIIHEFLKNRVGPVSRSQIVATDISQTMLRDAREGLFDKMTLDRGLSAARLSSYFEPQSSMWQLKNEIRDRVIFREFNLLGSYASLGKFDVIFCRNVLIYFSEETKRDILARIASALKPGGYLVLGGAESMANYSDCFEVVRLKNGLLYQLKG